MVRCVDDAMQCERLVRDELHDKFTKYSARRELDELNI